MIFGVVNKSTTVNRFVHQTLQRNITHIAVITRKINIKLGILKGGNWKRVKWTNYASRAKSFSVGRGKMTVEELSAHCGEGESPHVPDFPTK